VLQEGQASLLFAASQLLELGQLFDLFFGEPDPLVYPSEYQPPPFKEKDVKEIRRCTEPEQFLQVAKGASSIPWDTSNSAPQSSHLYS